MKRTIAMCLVTMLMLSLALAVYGETNSTIVTFSVDEICTVNIPESVNMSTSGASYRMQCTKNSDKRIAVSVSSQNGYKLKSNGNELNYKLLCDDTPVTTYGSDPFKIFETNGEFCDLKFEFLQGMSFAGLLAGDYTDRLTFTITYLD